MKVINYSHPNSRYDQMEVAVEYDKGGYSYFTGKRSERGYYLFLRPFKKANGTRTITILGNNLDSGGKLFLTAASRYSRKKEEKLNKVLEPYFEKVVKNFVDNDGMVDYELAKELREKIENLK